MAGLQGTSKVTQGYDADKILYYWKRIKHSAVGDKIQLLGLQGATSGTNQSTLTSTPTKTATLKNLGSKSQQRVVDVIFSNDPTLDATQTDLYKQLYAAWTKQEILGLWRVDFNKVSGEKGSRKVEAEFSQVLLPNLPNTEALGGNMNANITFEVNGESRYLQDDESAFTLDEKDFADGEFDSVAQFYGFAHGTDLGVDTDGSFIDNTYDGTAGGNGQETDPKA